MPVLHEEHKLFIVQRLAMFDTPTQVAEAVKEEFGLDLPREQVRNYNPDQAPQVAKKWRAIFEKTRSVFLESTAEVPIANRSVRLHRLERMALAAERMKNYPLAAQLHEQAAKEVGDVYTNRRQLAHSGALGIADLLNDTDDDDGAGA